MARGYSDTTRLRDALNRETVPEARDELIIALLMAEHPGAHAVVLAADEAARGDSTVRGLAVVGDHALANGTSHDVEMVRLVRGQDPLRILKPMVRVYDPDRLLEKASRSVSYSSSSALTSDG
jgi:hypothetical protein